MAVIFVIDGKPQNKQRLPYIPREGEVVEIASVDKTGIYVVDLVQHRIDLKSTIGVVDTMVHLSKTEKKKKSKKGD